MPPPSVLFHRLLRVVLQVQSPRALVALAGLTSLACSLLVSTIRRPLRPSVLRRRWLVVLTWQSKPLFAMRCFPTRLVDASVNALWKWREFVVANCLPLRAPSGAGARSSLSSSTRVPLRVVGGLQEVPP